MPRRAFWPFTMLLFAPPAAPADDAAIRAARSRFNQAIAAHDVAALDRDWAADIAVITSRGQRLVGREAYRESLAGQFTARPGLVYLRSPSRITVQEAWGTATEEGKWTGRWRDPDGPVAVEGRYVAQWRRENGAWKLSAELFGLTGCRGGKYCGEK